ncbi:MAG: isoleucine--tRNA ligase [Candidatus Blackburnbacteria bacterium]|nr:isoleucine--tRNA ligase [Candidatus Blackburnbacteria bacterium]
MASGKFKSIDKAQDRNKFRPVDTKVDFVALERELLKFWYDAQIVDKYLTKNSASEKKFSFLDGPITANNPMGVHHAWGRTYKDLFQRFKNMQGYKQRFQNGFDEQGLWVEVEVEKELGLKSKKDIENLVPKDKFASLEKFVNLCKERVKKYSLVQTEQSKRLGYFMDWDNSYHTSSDENNYWIWHFLKTVHDKGWLYKGRDSVPWCPRCGTAISQHEILTEEYKEVTHQSVFVEYPVSGQENTYLLVWTTTPWTLPANVAVAVDPNLDYVQVEKEGKVYVVAKGAVGRVFGDLPAGGKVIRECKGIDLVGWVYEGPFDNLPRVRKSLGEYKHEAVATDPLILPISDEEGTGLVHIAPGAGSEDFQLCKKLDLPVIDIIDEGAVLLGELGELGELGVKEVIQPIVSYLEEGGYLYKVQGYVHRYPTCWRCKSELVWRVVDEWYIAMDRPSKSKVKRETFREQMIEVAKKINWLPKWGLDRELDWLKNMHDWLISKKRYWGLALPIWECRKCGNFEVIGGKDELREKVVEGWDEFEGHSPHKPWIDQLKIKCSKCNEVTSRIPDVGNPWLDAGIVPFSTMPADWFPADFITESFPGQFKNWFYALIAMSTVLKRTNPFKSLLGHALVVDEKGEPMHKSSKNFIPFDEGVEKMGADVMRWIYSSQDPCANVPLTYGMGEEKKRRFFLMLWNVYNFFVTYANLDGWGEGNSSKDIKSQNILDRWVISRLYGTVDEVTKSLENYDARTAVNCIEEFVQDLSLWYVRRSRDRVGVTAEDSADKQSFYLTLWSVLTTLSRLLAPFVPFASEEIYKNLTRGDSVHLASWPLGNAELRDETLEKNMTLVRKIVERGHAVRKEASVPVRQPLASAKCKVKSEKLNEEVLQLIKDELNVKDVEWEVQNDLKDPEVELDTTITPELEEEGKARELARQIQEERKKLDVPLDEKVNVVAPWLPERSEVLEWLKRRTLVQQCSTGDKLLVERVDEG